VSGPQNDDNPQVHQLVVGRIETQSDGTRVMVSLNQKEAVLGHQQRVSELIAAAQAFKDNPLPETERALIRAALAL